MEPTSYRCGQHLVDVANRRFVHDGREIALEPRVFAVIAELLARPGELIARHELLDAVWGHRYVTPSTLNRTIALARRAFGDDVDEPRYIQTVHGAGYRYVGPIETAAPDSLARFAPPPFARLPARIAPLIGRETELASIARLLASGRAVSVIGTGGMGKTQCAIEAARRAAADFPDGIWFFDLVDLQSGEDCLRAMSAAMALPSSEPDRLLGNLCALLHTRRMLIVLDNCDRIASQVGSHVVQLLRATTELKVLATSQEPLNFAGEQLLPMPPLALPPRAEDDEPDPATVRAAPAVEMLLTRIRAALPDYALDEANCAAIAEICHRLDGMPLALELAATRFSLLSAEQVLERLDQRFRFLGGDAAGRDRRHQSLLGLLDWSYGLLSAEEQRLLEWCSLFVRSWSMETAAALAGTLGQETMAAVDLLAGLVNRSLVTVIPEVSPPRFRMLETVRHYALARLQASSQEADARRAHLAVVARMCSAAYADMRGGRMRERIEQLTLDAGNIAAAMETACSTPDLQTTALEIAGHMVLYAKAHGAYALCRQWCDHALASSAPLDSLARGRALLTAGVTDVHLSGLESAERLLGDAARIAAAHEDWWTEAYAHGYHALALANWDRPDEADAHALVTEHASRRHGDALLSGLAGLARGWICLSRGEPRAALEELGAVHAMGPDLHQQHFIRVYIGLTHFALGDLPGAAHEWLHGMRLSSAVANLRGVAGSMEGCAYLACRIGELAPAARLLAAAQLIRERTEVPLFRFWLPYRRDALAVLHSKLSAEEYASVWQAGEALRQEDAAEEARSLLSRIAGEPRAGG